MRTDIAAVRGITDPPKESPPGLIPNTGTGRRTSMNAYVAVASRTL